MARVFISYYHEDVDVAIRIYDLLEIKDLNPWRDKRDIDGGEFWSKEIDDAIADSYAMVVIGTENTWKSLGVTYEWAKAMGMGNIKIILVREDKTPPPAQFKPIHWFERQDAEFEENLTRGLKKYQVQDTLINIRIPVEADSQLKALAQQAFSSEYHIEINMAAIERLADMVEDEMARAILIAGLNERQYEIKKKILKVMADYHFDDVRVLSKLEKFFFLPFDANRKREERNNTLRELAARVMWNMGKRTVDILTPHSEHESPQIRKLIINTIYNTRDSSALIHLAAGLQDENEEIRQSVFKYILEINFNTHLYFEPYKQPLKDNFNELFLPIFKKWLHEHCLNYYEPSNNQREFCGDLSRLLQNTTPEAKHVIIEFFNSIKK